ncbi:MAG: WxL domain-containing protein [Chloroflexota bacterium]|nr:WxL domain-containing protein [Chloroflexota bacterium]
MKTFATRKSLYGMVTAAALSMMAVAPAVAQTTSTTAVVAAGSLNISNVAGEDFDTDLALTGLRHNATGGSLTFTVTDARGSGAGYSVTAQASPFKTAGDLLLTEDTAPNLLSIGSFTATAVGGDDASQSPAPSQVGSSAILDTGAAAVTILSAPADEGMGVYLIDAAALTLVIPGQAEAGSYSSTITLTTVPTV